MDYSKYLTAASEKSSRFDTLISSLKKDEDSLENEGGERSKLSSESQDRIKNLVSNYLSGSEEGELEDISEIYSTRNADSVESSSSKESKQRDSDLELTSNLTEQLENGGNADELFEEELLKLADGNFDITDLVKEEYIDGELVKTFKNADGQEITITTKSTDSNSNVHSTLTNEDGSTIKLSYANNGADGVEIERGTKKENDAKQIN